MVLKFFAGLTNLEDISDDELLPQPSDDELLPQPSDDELLLQPRVLQKYNNIALTTHKNAECSFNSYLQI